MTIHQQKNKRVLLGLSGGVDSTAAALLLQKNGFEVVGMFFDVLGNQNASEGKAKKAADELSIDFIYRDVSADFSASVVDYFCESYLNGETPNPCVKCNPAIKFKTMAEEADRIGADFLATGHYARIAWDESKNLFLIQKGTSDKRDQSYMLYRLGQDVLSRLLLPLGWVEDKETTRRLAREKGVSNAEAKDSQEICFIEQNESYIDYIKNWTVRMDRGQSSISGGPGNFIDKTGRLLGQHKGLVNYTVGQRKGLGITFGKPVFVTAMDSWQNTITLGSNEDLFSNEVISDRNFFTGYEKGAAHDSMPLNYENKPITAKIRYGSKHAPAVLKKMEKGRIKTVFEQPQRAAAPGQSIVFYDGDLVIGGGIICGK